MEGNLNQSNKLINSQLSTHLKSQITTIRVLVELKNRRYLKSKQAPAAKPP